MMSRRGIRNHPQPGLPGVNLLSASAFVRLATLKLRRRFLIAGVGLLVLMAASGALQHLRVAEAERLVAVERAEAARLGTDNQALAPIRAFVNGVAMQQQTVETNMAGEIYTSEVLEALQDAAPSRLRLETLTLTVETAPPAAGLPADLPDMTLCPGPDPFNTRPVIGCISLSGTAGSRAEVGELITSLGEVDLFVEPFISTTTTADTAGVSFAGSVGLSRDAFSQRFGNPDKTIAKGVSR